MIENGDAFLAQGEYAVHEDAGRNHPTTWLSRLRRGCMTLRAYRHESRYS